MNLDKRAFQWYIILKLKIFCFLRHFQKFSKSLENSHCDLQSGRFQMLPLRVAPSNYRFHLINDYFSIIF